jgi:hypothetical protein
MNHGGWRYLFRADRADDNAPLPRMPIRTGDRKQLVVLVRRVVFSRATGRQTHVLGVDNVVAMKIFDAVWLSIRSASGVPDNLP